MSSWIASLLAACGLCALTWPGRPAAPAASAPAAGTPTAADFGWLSGSWQRGAGKDLAEEHWTLPNGGSLLGMARTLSNGRTSFFEFLRVEEGRDGVDYVAQPGGRPPVRFRCTSLGGRKAVFENPTHDFPTTITYERHDDELIATISGPPTSREKPATFRFVRAGDEVRLPE